MGSAGLRKLIVLLAGLPPEAAVWRARGLPPAEEYAALLVERHDAWARAHFAALARHGGSVAVPPPIHIERPGRPVPEPKRMETDPRRIAAWFSKYAQA